MMQARFMQRRCKRAERKLVFNFPSAARFMQRYATIKEKPLAWVTNGGVTCCERRNVTYRLSNLMYSIARISFLQIIDS